MNPSNEKTPVAPGVDPLTAHHFRALKMVADSLQLGQPFEPAHGRPLDSFHYVDEAHAS